MRKSAPIAMLLVPVLLAGCVTTTTRTSTWSAADSDAWERPGRVEKIRETVTRQQGDPGGGAIAGALIGGLFGGMLFGHTHYDRWGYAHSHMSGAGAAVGAVGGAMAGAAASQGSAEDRYHEILVRFDDGSAQRFTFAGPVAFRIGERVALTPDGLQRR